MDRPINEFEPISETVFVSKTVLKDGAVLRCAVGKNVSGDAECWYFTVQAGEYILEAGHRNKKDDAIEACRRSALFKVPKDY